ncbi:FUSC family protein [Streptomonospora wellingtoniae]|uniref:Aromatic acid exporter family protein n=1 Tax=Streptomonospora wellingtoniae TaxID=3075544 RepID=A0ABU2KT56_9ACTN|nr:aromatic acid exporter family protein [Streptomonospora sp. DSM 45055]MDT0302470.1 aromatic acid exporter family protein [Streptomonospora sp. DSM 45055]
MGRDQQPDASAGLSASSGRQPTPTGAWARTVQWLRRARSDGHERHTLLMIAKSTLAATIAWGISYSLLSAQSPAFAPFSAVLMIQVTVYQSFSQALRYLGAVAAGVAVQGVVGFLAGPNLATFVLVAAIALAIGRWPRLGSQGSQVVTAAFFAFALYITATSMTERAAQLGSIILLVAIGCTVGVLVNVLVAPPMRFRSAEYGVRALAHALCELLSDMHPALREGQLDTDRTRQWRERANRMQGTVAQARSAVRTAEESVYYNPRKLLNRRHRRHTFTGYAGVVDALERVSYQLAAVTRTLDMAVSETGAGPQRTEFLGLYADLLAALAEITDELGEVEEDRLVEQARHLCGLSDQARDYAQRLAEGAEDITFVVTDRSSPYGTLLVEAARLQEEVRHTCDLLQRSVNREFPGSEPQHSGR